MDDLSTRAYLRHELTEYLDRLPVTIKIIRTRMRQGLVRARVQAADAAVVRCIHIDFLRTHKPKNGQQMNSSIFVFSVRVTFWCFWIHILNAQMVGWNRC